MIFKCKTRQETRKYTTFSSALLLVALTICACQAWALSPPNMTADVSWDENPAVAGDQTSFFGVVAIEAAYNNGRRVEENQLGLAANALGDLNLPAQATWDALSIDEQALSILNAERSARAVVYPGHGLVLGLEFTGIEGNIDALAQDYADYMVANNFWAHDVPTNNPAPFNNTDSFSRIDNHPVIGNGAGTNNANCHQFLTRAENLSIFGSTGTIPMLMERSLYGFIYDDSSSNWGHREALFLQDVALGQANGGFNNDSGDAASEGYIGIGIAGASNGTYNPVGFDLPNQQALVFLMFDPTSDSACNYATNDTSPPPTAVTTLLAPGGSITSNSPTYQWNAVPQATWYYLWVSGSTGIIHRQWYRSSTLGCAASTICSITPTAVIPDGSSTWWVQTWNINGYGPWSAAKRFSYGTAPAAVSNLINPAGAMTTASPIFTWASVAGASWYKLYVNDGTGNRLQQWYSATSLGCATGGNCTHNWSLFPLSPGSGEWWVQTWNIIGTGPWSAGMTFTVN